MTHRVADSIYSGQRADSAPGNLAVLYADYRERLLRFVTPKVGCDNQAAEDIVQEAFAAAIVSLAGFGARSSPYTWLCSIAQHKIADYYRKSPPSNAEVLVMDPDMCRDENDVACCSSVEHWFEAVETRDTVQNALRELPHIYGEVLRLKYFEGLSMAEIGSRLGRSSKAIEGLLARARHALSENVSCRVTS